MTKAQLSKEDIVKLADLAKIEISIEETENYLKDINNILGHLSMVNEADLTNVENTFPFVNYTRADVAKTQDGGTAERDFDTETIFSDIPSKSKDNYVKVSKVIKK
jgi:aspartyl/glutamyl-tRNA(Asn/Gln) amidotransferase C subunit